MQLTQKWNIIFFDHSLRVIPKTKLSKNKTTYIFKKKTFMEKKLYREFKVLKYLLYKYNI